MEKRNQIPHIVRISQKLRRWRKKAHAAASVHAPSDVPAGHLAVVVGALRRRYVVRAALLNHPVFQGLLVKAEEEYGFAHPGPLAFPCDEPIFEAALRIAARQDLGRSPTPEELQTESCHAGARRRAAEFRSESRPLLNEV